MIYEYVCATAMFIRNTKSYKAYIISYSSKKPLLHGSLGPTHRVRKAFRPWLRGVGNKKASRRLVAEQASDIMIRTLIMNNTNNDKNTDTHQHNNNTGKCKWLLHMQYVNICVYRYLHLYIYIYIYIWRERERDVQKGIAPSGTG